ncbi:MAG: DUF1800 domain-containing protein [Fimbriimonadaceae bacterium]
MMMVTDRQKCAHLLRRFGLGASEAELDYYLSSGGIQGAIQRLLDYDKVDEGFDIAPTEFANAKGKLNPGGLIAWWTVRLLQTRRPLQERMTMFWHDHFATSAAKVNAPGILWQQNEIFRRNATGNFKTLLTETSKDPAMILYLDNQTNIKGRPNENFAREVMELFTLGIGHYTEHDIQQSARAYTGWSLQRQRQSDTLRTATFLFRPRLHDDGPKEFFGHTGNFDGDDILDMLCSNPRMAEYIAWKLWRWFGYDKPEDALVARLATVFIDSGLNIRSLLEAMMTAPEFYSDKAHRAIFKSPADFVLATARQLGLGEMLLAERRANPAGRLRGGPIGAVANSMKNTGMQLFFPPDVAGWRGGSEWISTGNMVQRIAWADSMFGTGNVTGVGRLDYNAFGLFATDPTPHGVAHKLASVFDAPLPADKLDELESAARKAVGDTITEANANKAAAAAGRLMFASPEFQFC